MVTVGVDTNIFKILDIAVPGARLANAKWFAADITVNTSNALKGTTVVIDFAFDVSTVVEYTLGGDATGTYIAFNQGLAVVGGQSRYIRIETGDQLNFRAVQPGNLTRAIVGEV